MPVTESLSTTQCRTCHPLFSLTLCATTAVGALVVCPRCLLGAHLHVSVCMSVVFPFVYSVCVYVCVLKRLIHACGDNVWREEGERLEMCTRWKWCLIVDDNYV